jgi:hypothetical protein
VGFCEVSGLYVAVVVIGFLMGQKYKKSQQYVIYRVGRLSQFFLIFFE